MLVDYETGVDNSAATAFSAATFRPIHNEHLRTLDVFETRAPGAIRALQQDLYMLAR